MVTDSEEVGWWRTLVVECVTLFLLYSKGLGHEKPSYRMAELNTPTQDKQRQGKSIENSVDPSFVLSKILYHMAQLSSV